MTLKDMRYQMVIAGSARMPRMIISIQRMNKILRARILAVMTLEDMRKQMVIGFGN
jgi:hypothetical protein